MAEPVTNGWTGCSVCNTVLPVLCVTNPPPPLSPSRLCHLPLQQPVAAATSPHVATGPLSQPLGLLEDQVPGPSSPLASHRQYLPPWSSLEEPCCCLKYQVPMEGSLEPGLMCSGPKAHQMEDLEQPKAKE